MGTGSVDLSGDGDRECTPSPTRPVAIPIGNRARYVWSKQAEERENGGLGAGGDSGGAVRAPDAGPTLPDSGPKQSGGVQEYADQLRRHRRPHHHLLRLNHHPPPRRWRSHLRRFELGGSPRPVAFPLRFAKLPPLPPTIAPSAGYSTNKAPPEKTQMKRSADMIHMKHFSVGFSPGIGGGAYCSKRRILQGGSLQCKVSFLPKCDGKWGLF
ncbi:hypothetical protein Cgig2_005591 [Carnegiea gigantea]|uniref:Uncharacterized protein n=1 Tax=Carnegiea gigantea TaxID=171969 RepID=A0A9Q1KTV3_9CARY|nr:hypothetical protein Cgig2_005591 [Carnegiea gigantea]